MQDEVRFTKSILSFSDALFRAVTDDTSRGVLERIGETIAGYAMAALAIALCLDRLEGRGTFPQHSIRTVGAWWIDVTLYRGTINYQELLAKR